MSALFRSFISSLLVMLSIPLATFGGVLALYLINLISFQSMDLLTMIGFIILLGLVVNNAILLVYQARAAERDGADLTFLTAASFKMKILHSALQVSNRRSKKSLTDCLMEWVMPISILRMATLKKKAFKARRSKSGRLGL